MALLSTLAVASAPKAPVIWLQSSSFGRILATPTQHALYYWQVEKDGGGAIRCTGGCAKLWPPLVVGSAGAVPRGVEGIKGSFGTIRRPDGRLQVTYNGLALYTYVHEGPNVVLCNNVEGWFVVQL